MRLVVKDRKYEPTYIDVRTFDDQAYACAEYMRKGRKIAVTGRLVYEEWRDAEEKRRERYSVIGWVEFLDPPAERRGWARNARARARAAGRARPRRVGSRPGPAPSGFPPPPDPRPATGARAVAGSRGPTCSHAPRGFDYVSPRGACMHGPHAKPAT